MQLKVHNRHVGRWLEVCCLVLVGYGLSYQLLLISNNSCHIATKLAVVPDLRGVLQPPEPPAGHAPAFTNLLLINLHSVPQQ